MRYLPAPVIFPQRGGSKPRAPSRRIWRARPATSMHGSCRGARLSCGLSGAVGGPELERGREARLELPERLEVRIHPHQAVDQALRLLRHPPELLDPDRVDGAADLLVEGEQLRNVPDAALGEAAHELAVVPNQLLGLSTDVARHAPSVPHGHGRIDGRRHGGLHPSPPVRQQENRLRREEAAAGGSPFDAIRLEQFLALEHDVLVAAGDPATLSDRLAQAVTVFLGVAGAAVGVVDGGVYRVLATYGVPRDYAARYDGVSIRVAPLESAFAGARPVVVDDDFAGAALRTFLLPFRGHVLAGALHVITAREAVPADDDVRLARALAELAGVALDNARQWERLTAVARLRGDALATMAHDLRTPLNALVGYATLLGEGAFGTLVPEQQTIADTLARQAVELVDLLGATLDVARLESGRLPIRRDEFSLADLLRTMLAGTFAAAARDGVLT